MKKNRNKRTRYLSDIYSGNSDRNFFDLMGQHFALKHSEWDIYRKAIMLNDIKGANKAVEKIRLLLAQEVEILIRFGKIVPQS